MGGTKKSQSKNSKSIPSPYAPKEYLPGEWTMKWAPTYPVNFHPNQEFKNNLGLQAVVDYYSGQLDVLNVGACVLEFPTQRIPHHLLKTFHGQSVGKVKVTRFEDQFDHGCYMMIDEPSKKILNTTYDGFRQDWLLPEFALTSTGISKMIKTVLEHDTITKYRADIRLVDDTVYSANSFINPLNYRNKAGDLSYSPWAGVVGITSPDYMVSLGASATGFHFEDHGFGSFGYMLIGGAKLWIFIHNSEQNIMRYLDLVNSHMGEYGYRPCRGMTGDRNFFLTIEILEAHEIEFSLALQQPGQAVITLPLTCHAVFTFPSSQEDQLTVLHSLNYAPLDLKMEYFLRFFNTKLTCPKTCLIQHGNPVSHIFTADRLLDAIGRVQHYLSRPRKLPLLFQGGVLGKRFQYIQNIELQLRNACVARYASNGSTALIVTEYHDSRMSPRTLSLHESTVSHNNTLASTSRVLDVETSEESGSDLDDPPPNSSKKTLTSQRSKSTRSRNIEPSRPFLLDLVLLEKTSPRHLQSEAQNTKTGGVAYSDMLIFPRRKCHVPSEMKNGVQKFQCIFCPTESDYNNSIRKHLVDKHGKVEYAAAQCCICLDLFGSLDHCRRHLVTHCETVGLASCCLHKFSGSVALEKHISTVCG